MALSSSPVMVAVVTGVMAIATGVVTGLITAVYAPKLNWNLKNKERLQKRNIKIINGVSSFLDDKSNTVMDLSDFSDFGYIEDSFSSEEREHYKELKSQLRELGYNYLRQKYGYDEKITQKSLGSVKFSQLVARINGEDREEIVSALNYSAQSHKIKRLIRQKLRKLEYEWGLVGK